jgi:xeroderma pigmentosum group C-complementing protein
MLAETNQDDVEEVVGRPLKKRRITSADPPGSAERTSRSIAARAADVSEAESLPSSRHVVPALSRLQTVEDSSESDGTDFEFEDVDLEGHGPSDEQTMQNIEDLSISLQPESSARHFSHPRRKPITAIEKSHRLMVHKMHIVCLLVHCLYINGRCNNTTVHRHLRSILPDRTISYLKPKQTDSQFQRNRSFLEGLQHAVNAFVACYHVTGSGLAKPRWSLDGEDYITRNDGLEPIDREMFIVAAKNLEGSQDTGNQLFCAMLRSAGIDARLACSLQPLPFANVPKATPVKKPKKTKIMAIASDVDPSKVNSTTYDTAVSGSRSIGKVGSVRRRLGQPSFMAETIPVTPAKKAKPVAKLQYPVFWVEAFNEAQQKWIAVDAMVTNSVNRPTILEPPSVYDLNHLTYVLAFEQDGSARDVTRRYAKAYNAKTRRYRVESSPGGAKWWKKMLRVFRRPGLALDRDQVEDAELAAKEAKEGMPANILDFKDHPFYALKRHLKRQEVIHPLREVGKVNAGTAAKPRMEPVFRREDVLTCKSADKWYRLGREIKEGEQPLKHVPARARRQRSVEDGEGQAQTAATTALYAGFQTKLYVPPAVQNGRVLKNVYGNLDVYVPSMVPAGGVHIRHPLTQRAARLLRIDYADAVVGFQFKGRHGTAIVEGAVVPVEHVDAVRTVIAGFEDEALEEDSRARSLRALKFWKRFLTGLRIAQRVRTYGKGPVEENLDAERNTLAEIEEQVFETAGPPLLTAGRFSIAELEGKTKSTKPRSRPVVASDSEEDVGGMSEDGAAGGFFPEPGSDAASQAGGFLPDVDGEDYGPGRFEPEPDEAQGGGGGFISEDEDGGDAGRTVEHDRVEDRHADDGGGGGFLPEEDDLFGERPDRNNSDASPMDETEPTPQESSHQIAVEEVPAGPRRDEYAVSELESPHSDTRGDEERFNRPEALETSPTRQEESDTASILSHDPEDDEAEPEWLESD